MDEYVPVEAYDVMLGSDGFSTTGSGDPNRASDATGSATGVTGKGWDLLYYDFASGTVKTMNVYGSNHDEVEAKIVPYLNMYGGSYVASIGCS